MSDEESLTLNEAQIATATGERRRRAGGRGAERIRKPSGTKYLNLVNNLARTELLSPEALDDIHEASLTILEEIGMDIILPEARERMKAAGADVTPGKERVRFDRNMIMELIASIPSAFTLHARNPLRNVEIGGRNLVFAQVASAPFVADREGGRRAGNQEDFRKLIKLAQSYDVIHMTGGYPVEPIDIHASVRHLDCLSDIVKLTDKAFHCYSLGKQRNLDAIEIARIGRGISMEQMEREPSLFTIINSSSPLRLDGPMLQGIIEMSSRGQVVVVTPFTLAGAMAPVTIAGALVQQNAEALCGLAFTQMVRKGAPVMYGGFTSNVDMKTGAPAFGTPEYMKAVIAGGQLARRYGIPYRTSNTNASNTLDAQAAYESALSLWALTQGGGNFVLHAAGWSEGGLTASFEKFILDVDMLQMVAEFLTPLDVSSDALALDAVRDVGPGGHYFGTAHTLARYETAFYSPILSDWRNNETWTEAGRPTTYDHANRVYKETLERYERPPLDPAIEEELDAFVAKRKAEGGVPTDF
ncbi:MULTISPECIES: trimethylamine methyltransferase family protein [Rhizobium]|uniref:Methyltransferase n=1 Tax=Rhizobium tropici TaxID=398 RepID=A0A329YMK2_RHITR|nr:MULTISPECIES: trimethylamine methyltransferase family protein [Rhizobium]MBB3287795.1 trimethylamine--corrinoid protein Co-methyltransferase [Rhizobium sp. BK252]MBB3402601.1 trimethylamine--corrinoid protein Co-methyltransferase [Rhizobium sp. BK289]MBB3415177.1 trimethylamine--corrinoid protein Co-methyltransferase [Rhizobium sp. BK284]MBB3483066.1 trimethylamine--corrinoid protein Co-methyltransferase [Rhizobium sp. BK347]MDK4720691.1 trimethylamine methyltransferase family protein [Rhiz